MLDKNTAKTLEKNVLEHINRMYPADSSLAHEIAKISIQTAIITLQEYEKLKSNNQ
ncbi:MAG: hypothetical protein ACFWT2_15665 [Thermoanaerobacterium thermosaccharolyticum]|jgi:hypothetical protein